MPNFPPTILVVHPRERRKKCTVAPLRGKQGFIFWKYPNLGTKSLAVYVRLGLGGPLLSADDADRGLFILDGTWRLTAGMERDFSHIPVRSLPPFKTAYPRSSKLFTDPTDGLATIEALYVAFRILNRDCGELLDGYRWKEEFLRLNDFA